MKQRKNRYVRLQSCLKCTSLLLLLMLPFLTTGCGEKMEMYLSSDTSLDELWLLEESQEGDGFCMVWDEELGFGGSPYLLSGKYVVEGHWEGWHREKTFEDEETIFVYTIHDLQNGAESTIKNKDLEAVLSKELRFKEYSEDFFEYQQKWYFSMRTEYRDEETRWQRRHDNIKEDVLVVDLESGETEMITWEEYTAMYPDDQKQKEYTRDLAVLRQGLLNANGFRYELTRGYEGEQNQGAEIWFHYKNVDSLFDGGFMKAGTGEITIVVSGDGLPKHNEALYAKFPELEQYQGKACWILLLLTDWPSSEEIMRLLLEDGQEISFEGVTVPAEYSIDGQEHKVESFEDWDKWYIGMLRE